MRAYIGAKIIEAEPMSFAEFREKHYKLEPSTKEEEGYAVRYPDGYLSWSPKSVFEEAYRLVNEKEALLIN